MKQSQILEAITTPQAAFRWVPLQGDVEVMAWPVRIDGQFIAVSARTADACAARLSSDGWVVSLTTPKIEDLIWEHAASRPEPVLLNPSKVNIASDAAIKDHSTRLQARLASIAEDALVACGKSWVLSNGLLDRPGRAANYGLFSTSAPHRSATGAYRLWQPLSFAHNLDHFDYSQMLRLARRRTGTALPSYDQPLRILGLSPDTAAPEPDAPEPSAVGTLGERCLAWCLEEAATHRQPTPERIAWYHAVAVRNGKPLGITKGNHCASAQSRALVECLLQQEVKPHEPRAGAVELQRDAVQLGRWRSIAEVHGGRWLPRAGDLAIYNRADPARPETSWMRHVDRVIRVSEDGTKYENIGANEIAGAWNREWTAFGHSRLLGFVEYPGFPASASERALAEVALEEGASG